MERALFDLSGELNSITWGCSPQHSSSRARSERLHCRRSGWILSLLIRRLVTNKQWHRSTQLLVQLDVVIVCFVIPSSSVRLDLITDHPWLPDLACSMDLNLCVRLSKQATMEFETQTLRAGYCTKKQGNGTTARPFLQDHQPQGCLGGLQELHPHHGNCTFRKSDRHNFPPSQLKRRVFYPFPAQFGARSQR
jgi:hypothetical protein